MNGTVVFGNSQRTFSDPFSKSRWGRDVQHNILPIGFIPKAADEVEFKSGTSVTMTSDWNSVLVCNYTR